MEFKIWKTKISECNCEIGGISQSEIGALSIEIKNDKNDLFVLNVLPELYEVGSEQHYFDWWKKLNFQNLDSPKTTLIIDNSEWIDRFSYLRDNKMDYQHYLIIGIDKVVNLISESEPTITKK